MANRSVATFWPSRDPSGEHTVDTRTRFRLPASSVEEAFANCLQRNARRNKTPAGSEVGEQRRICWPQDVYAQRLSRGAFLRQQGWVENEFINWHAAPPLALAEFLTAHILSMISEFATKLKAIRREIREEYTQLHSKPWIIGFSGGKDSTILAHLVLECILAIPPDERKRRVFILSNDTLVESPIFQSFVNRLLDQMAENIPALRVPVAVVKTQPEIEESFWANLLGRGYPAPNRMFRWCTDRMKIRPTSKFIRQQVSLSGEAILLLGVRRSESAHRARNIEKHTAAANGRLSPHTDFKGCYIFTPIKDLTTTEVWATLINSKPPWGGTYGELTTLYKDALAGECPFVMSTNDAPSCGTNSARFGCWTCTVIEKDNSLESLITSGHYHLEPLSNFRKRLKEVSDNPDFRSKIRRTGQPGLGPLTMDAREMLLEELLAIQAEVGFELISSTEVRLIKEQWAVDESDALFRDLARLESAKEPTCS